MTCPHCQKEIEASADRCMECGFQIVRKISGIVKTSTVMIAAGDEQTFYSSMQDVPETLRRRLIETTNSANSGMIVIADRAGREQWTEVIAQRESQAFGLHRSPDSPEPEPDQTLQSEPSEPWRFAGLPWAAWAGILLFLAAAILIGSVFQVIRW